MKGYRLARGTSTWLYVVGLVFLATLAGAALAVEAAQLVLAGAAILVGVLFVALLNFFRDPERRVGAGIVAPADGVVTEVTVTDEGTRINTFMNPLNVHVNRAPIAGRVTRAEHVPGGFVPAFKKESERNERVIWEFETEAGPVRLVQIAGAVARRIIPYKTVGEKVEKGERIGIIRLGSRVDLYLPPGPQVTVAPGENVKAGETQLATLA